MDLFATADGSISFSPRLGLYHPVVIHFPIALILTAAFLEILRLWKRNEVGLRWAVGINLLLGTAFALLAATLGWLDAAHIGIASELKPTLAWHRWLGVTVAVGSLLTSWLWFNTATTSRGGLILWSYRIALLALALLVAIVGHLGGLLVYGLDYFTS